MSVAVVRVQAAIARAMIRAMGMQAENAVRSDRGLAPAYDEAAFADIIDDEHIDWNSVDGETNQ